MSMFTVSGNPSRWMLGGSGEEELSGKKDELGL